MDERLALLTLCVLDLPPAKVRRALTAGAGAVIETPDAHPDLLPESARTRVRSGEAANRARGLALRCAQEGIGLVALGDSSYPRRLGEICDPPPVLFVKGSLACLSRGPVVALVGTRAATARGQAFARSLAGDLAALGAVVVSGLARGIDAAAHTGALEAGGATLGVLGSGFDHFYPRENLALAQAMVRDGAVVSEYPPQIPPSPGRFPQRNRVIAGLCEGLIVVEAPSRSGALVTARLALDAGREVMAVPGFPGLRNTEGTNDLLRDGATLIRHAADVAASLGLEPVPRTPEPTALGSCPIRSLLTRGVPYGLEEIQERTGLEGPGLLSRLGELELAGVVRRLPGARYVLGTLRKSS